MKIYQIPRTNAPGLIGPEKAPEEILNGINSEKIQINNSDIEESEKQIYKKARDIFSKEKPIFVGGDHSITYPILKAFKEKTKNPFLIIFDAHADCDFCSQEPTHEEWLRAIIESGFEPRNIIIIGLRKSWEIEQKFLKENKIKVYEHITEETINKIKEKSKKKQVYLSIDIDAIDPKFAPAVNYQEKNGIKTEDFKQLLKQIIAETNIHGVDLVEVVPEKDIDGKTIKLAREIISILNAS
jgi:agmatinase